MIEWIFLGLVGLAALAGGKKEPFSSTSNAKKTNAASLSAARERNALLRQNMVKWRAAWEPSVDRTKWIASGKAKQILKLHPVPARPLDIIDRIRGRDPTLDELKAEFEAHNQAFLALQKERLSDFFNTVEKNPLTEEQIKACVCMDRHVQIVAAAGSGKTSTMVAKAGYALREGLAEGKQILLLAFNADAANELAERIQDRLEGMEGATDIRARTFNAFGLDVIGKATGKKPSLAPWLENAGDDIKMLSNIIEDLCARDEKFKNDWLLFRTVFGRDVGSPDAEAEPDAYGDGRRGFRTARGEIVKSKEERLIADWLFYHNVAYAYERPYEHDTASEKFRQYNPDFYYPDADLYHEHFALNASGKAPDHFGYRYLEGVIWKRKLHEEMGTDLIETTSHQVSEGTALKHLEAELARRGVETAFDPNREALGAKPLSVKEFTRTIRVFQQHVKSNGISGVQLREAIRTRSFGANVDRLTRFVDIYEPIADAWECKLREGGWIDFEDMVNLAAEHIESGRFQSPYTMVLSDEFQDSSRARIRLLKALAGQNRGSVHLCVVGDDWQGINRFAGADISVMNEFDQIFPEATRLTMGTTFRCPQPLCDASSAFIQANPVQIQKDVKSTNIYTAKSYLFAYAFQEMSRVNSHLVAQFEQMRHYLRTGRIEPGKGGRVSILLLGRYRNDRPVELNAWKRRFGEHLDIDFKTVHASKGLEADYVMLLNVVEGNRGFPSQIEDDPVLQIPMPAPDPFPMAEERRLFYVALTRARRQVRIYTSIEQPSRFLIELARNGALVIEPIDAEALEPCPKCSVGVMKRRSGQYGDFESCATWPRCDFTRDIQDSAASVPLKWPR